MGIEVTIQWGVEMDELWLKRLIFVFAVFWGTYEIVIRGLMGDDLRPEVLPLVGGLLITPYARKKDQERQQEEHS